MTHNGTMLCEGRAFEILNLNKLLKMNSENNVEVTPSSPAFAKQVLAAVNVGDEVFEIHCVEDKLYVNTRTLEYISKKGRLICGFEPFNGLKAGAINQFNRQYRCWWERGNHLNMFRCYSLKSELDKNIQLFHKRFKKLCGYDLPSAVFNSR